MKKKRERGIFSLLLISVSSSYRLSAFLPLIGYQHFFFPKQNMKSSSGAMSRSPKSPSLFGIAEGCKRFFICSEFSLLFISISFFQSKNRNAGKEKVLFSRKEIDPLLPGDGNHRLRRLWRRNSQVRRALFYFFGWFEVPLSLFALEGYRAQTPCDLYSLLLVISYHPPASCWGRSVFY